MLIIVPLQFIHDPLLTWRLTNAQSPAGPNFQSEREQALGGPAANQARRPSILDVEVTPSELLAQQAGAEGALPGGPPGLRPRARTNSSTNAAAGSSGARGAAVQVNGSAQQQQDPTEMQNARALEVLDRVSQKLTGRDFKPTEELDIISQVNKLIMEATKLENLCQHYIGWCSFW